MNEKQKAPASAEAQYKKMTETPVPKLVLSLGIPTTISMLITNVYNMADTYFVSRLGTSAGGATSVVFGLMAILQAFGFMFGHGAGSNISRMLGSKQQKRASQYASTSFFAALGCGLVIMIGGLLLLEPLMRLLGSTDTILPHAKGYAKWILIAAPAMTASCVLNNILRYEGKATLAMVGLTTGGILNILLDPVFICNGGEAVFGMALPFGFGMGTEGAGLATAISQYISFSILLSMFLLKRTQSKLALNLLQKDLGTIGDIVITGLPSLARQGLNSVSTMVLNNQAKPFEDAAIAAMGYVGRTSSLIFCVGLGIGQGFQPVSGYNYGAKKYSRVKKAALFTLAFGAGFIGLISLAGFIGARQVIGMFSNEAEVIAIGSRALRIQCAFLISLPVSVVATMLFQSIGKSVRALVLSCLQSGLLFIPLCAVLPHFIGITGIQISQPLAYFLSATVSVPTLLLFLKKLPKDGN